MHVYGREKWNTKQKLPFEPIFDINSQLWAEHEVQSAVARPTASTVANSDN
jgi:hypothetical protein